MSLVSRFSTSVRSLTGSTEAPTASPSAASSLWTLYGYQLYPNNEPDLQDEHDWILLPFSEVFERFNPFATPANATIRENPTQDSSSGGLKTIHIEQKLGAFLKKDLCNFGLYLSPNEFYPENIQTLLAQMKKGWIVSTGTERSLFDLLLAPDCCEGVIIRDIQWKAKAYIDCLILLFRLYDSQEEFKDIIQSQFQLPSDINLYDLTSDDLCTCLENMIQDYSTNPGSSDIQNPYSKYLDAFKAYLNNKLMLIKMRLEKDTKMPPKMKAYYLEHLEDLVHVYFGCSDRSPWHKMEQFSSVNYINDPAMFSKLQSYARAGRIIATVGSINDLAVFDDLQISLVDTSNISQYTLLDIQIEDALIVWTTGTGGSGTYYSCTKNQPLNQFEKQECIELFDCMKKVWFENSSSIATESGSFASMLGNQLHLFRDSKEDRSIDYYNKKATFEKTMTIRSFSKSSLEFAKEYWSLYIFQVSPECYIDISRATASQISVFSQYTQEELENLNPSLKDLYPELVKGSGPTTFYNTYPFFGHLKGWQDAFEKRFTNPEHKLELKYLMQNWGRSDILSKFKGQFGHERFAPIEKLALEAAAT